MMNQKQRAERLIESIWSSLDSTTVDSIAYRLSGLDRVLGEAQNGPPDGEADGSMTPEQWTQWQDLCVTLTLAIGAIQRARR